MGFVAQCAATSAPEIDAKKSEMNFKRKMRRRGENGLLMGREAHRVWLYSEQRHRQRRGPLVL
jgi:hypothetical protein